MERTFQATCKTTGPFISGWLIVPLLLRVAVAQPLAVRPAYEVASVKPDTSGTGHSSSQGSKGQIVFTNLTLRRLIERAYGVKPFQVAGPDWMESIHFDIVAKYPPDTKPDDRSAMLRTLLEDRFRLSVHRESKDLPGYELLVAKKGFKLKPVEPGGSDTSSNGGLVQTLTAKKTSMERLVDIVARNLGETVIDRTGIEGVYDFELRWTKDDQKTDISEPDAAPSLFTALQETLGLRLQARKVPVEIIVVDHVEQIPVEN